ncbi:adenylate kinase [Puniceicoccales bacterium CK1056]|uniref:Adenylate kinase n=1 Tax=Oceanipulchritudo coccoides TaxID=2706888 RepID=A0A6B2M5J1_9BACT|nr:adenylate kinase [Oceanipulchritudo coccoides]NDV63482.1 adenylate kinase [Oceanipulchritudo coccoides]
MLNIALFGPPGAGKGTQSEFLIEKYNLTYISTGELLRKELTEGTALGEQAREIIASGGLVPDEIIVQIIEKTIAENSQADGFLFDGFPRTTIQAYILEGLMIKLNTSLTCLIDLEVSEKISIERLVNRGKTSGRSDDNEAVIRNRLKEYHEKTLPVLQFYKDKGVRYQVDASRSVEEVNRDVLEIVRKEQRKRLFNVVIFGHPGSGRGSQGRALAEHFGLEYVATGPMLEKEIREGTELGKKIEALYESGKLVTDEIVVPLIEQRLENSKGVRGFIFKGFPRTLVQSYILEGLLRKHDATISKVIEIEVPTLELIRRLDERSKTDRCMPYDSSTAKIVKRLQEHETKTVPVIEKYNQLHEVFKVDGMDSFEVVFKRIADIIEPPVL